MRPKHAITVRLPWADQLLRGTKPAEFRNWRLGERFVGVPLLLHAGRWDDGQRVYPEIPTGSLIAVVVFGEPEGLSSGPWAWAWPVQSILPLTRPIPARGMPGLWRPPEGILAQVEILPPF